MTNQKRNIYKYMIIMITMNKQKLTCRKCSYSWIPRKGPNKIKECPRCKSRDWKPNDKKQRRKK